MISASPAPEKEPNPWPVLLIIAASLFAVLFLAAVTVGAYYFLTPRGANPGTQSNSRATPSAKSESGVKYSNDKVSREPWSIHVVKIDRSQKDLQFATPHARDKILGVSMLADQARSIPPQLGQAVAAINGDFYVRDNPIYAGDPRGLQIANGELLSAPDTVCIWFDAQGNPHLDEVKADFNVTWPDKRKTAFGLNQQRPQDKAVLYTPTYGASTRAVGGKNYVLEKDGDGPWLPLAAGQTYRARVREVQATPNTPLAAGLLVLSVPERLPEGTPEAEAGAIVEISTATAPDLKGVKAAIGGGPTLIKDGQAFTAMTAPAEVRGVWSERSKYERHPRAAVGWSPTHFYFVIVDGRQPELSVGMKLAELADYMKKLGCTDAMNLDGGKSAQMWMNGRIMNSPCQGEDTVANSIVLLRTRNSGN